jgi:hypothetical protein
LKKLLHFAIPMYFQKSTGEMTDNKKDGPMGNGQLPGDGSSNKPGLSAHASLPAGNIISVIDEKMKQVEVVKTMR